MTTFLTPRAFQKRLHQRGFDVTLDTIWRWCSQDPPRVRSKKIGRRRVIPEAEVDRLLGMDSGADDSADAGRT